MKVEIGNATLYLGDCLEILPTLPKVDAVVTDPPYGISRDCGFGVGGKGKGGKPRRAVKRWEGGWDATRPDIEFVLDIAPAAIVWGGQFFAPSLPIGGKWLWWDKLQTMPSYGDGEMAWTNLPGTAIKKFTLSNQALIAQGQVGLHPTQKPVAVMEWCLSFIPNAGTIMDPYMGSGTTGVACMNLGRKFIGIEIDPKYFAIACERIRAAQDQGRLFA